MNKATDDLISRTAALEIIDAIKSTVWSQSGKVLCGKINSQIKSIPSVNAAPIAHGLWIYFNGAGNEFYQCSECFHWIDAKTDKNYCPNCGAKMETKNE